MRPKVVILTLVVAFAALAGIFLLKGTKPELNSGGDETALTVTDGPAQTGGTEMASQAPIDAGQPSPAPVDAGPPVVDEDARNLEIARQMDEINSLQVEAVGDNNVSVIIPALLGKMTHSELAVRSAALDTLRQLNDTNAIPGLQQALETIKDAREKLAVMDTIDYLKLPGMFDQAEATAAAGGAATPATAVPNSRPKGAGQPRKVQ